MTQTKWDTLVLQDGRWAWDRQPHPVNIIYCETNFRLYQNFNVLNTVWYKSRSSCTYLWSCTHKMWLLTRTLITEKHTKKYIPVSHKFQSLGKPSQPVWQRKQASQWVGGAVPGSRAMPASRKAGPSQLLGWFRRANQPGNWDEWASRGAGRNQQVGWRSRAN